MTIGPIATDRAAASSDDRAPRRLKRRAEFLHVGRGRRWHGAAMTIQAAPRRAQDCSHAGWRVGYTLTKKVGNAVVRNRARRRLREAVRLGTGDLPVLPGYDYVIVGRIDALRLPFASLHTELTRGLLAVRQPGKDRRSKKSGPEAQPSSDAAPAADAAPERIRPRP